MNKAHSLKNWENYPSINTPLNAQNLNELDVSVDEIDNRVITLDTTKASKIELSEFFNNVSFDEQTGIITFTRKNGATIVIDTALEKIATGIYYNPTTEKLTVPLIDGTQFEVDLSRLITEYEFVDSDTIAFSVSVDGKVTAIVKEGSIEEKHLRPDYLADIKVEAAKAESSANDAAQSAENAEDFAKIAESHNHGGTGVREGEDTDNSKYWSEQSKQHLDDTVRAGENAVKNIGNAENSVLDNISQAENDAMDTINNALDGTTPTFYLDPDTKKLYYTGGSFVFELTSTGKLLYGVAV